MVDGDDIRVQASVGTGATAFVSTQSATKVYRSPHGTRVALDADVREGGLLVVAPDAVVCFAGSRYRQTQRITIAAGGALVLLDWVTSGRRESGERWVFDEYVSRTVVHLEGRLVVHDAMALRAADGRLADRFGRYDVLAVAVLIGRGLEADIGRLDAQVEPVERGADRLRAECRPCARRSGPAAASCASRVAPSRTSTTPCAICSVLCPGSSATARGRGSGRDMHLTPREVDKLVLHQAGFLAQKRLARGLRLNYVEAVALIGTQLLEFIRDGRSVAELMDLGRRFLGTADVLDGIAGMVDEVQVEGTFPDGTKLVTVHHPIVADHGDHSLALYGSFLEPPGRFRRRDSRRRGGRRRGGRRWPQPARPASS